MLFDIPHTGLLTVTILPTVNSATRISQLLAFGFAADRFLMGQRTKPPSIPYELKGLTLEEASIESLHITQELLRGDGCF